MQVSSCYYVALILGRMNPLENVNSFLKMSDNKKINEQKTVLLYFKPGKFRIKPVTYVMANDTVIKMEVAGRYLGHMITDSLDGSEDIKHL